MPKSRNRKNHKKKLQDRYNKKVMTMKKLQKEYKKIMEENKNKKKEEVPTKFDTHKIYLNMDR